jgi:hypothetical protein
MTDAATTARLMNVAESAVEEFDRQGVAEVLANLNFDPVALAQAVIKAADGDVIPSPAVPGIIEIQRRALAGHKNLDNAESPVTKTWTTLSLWPDRRVRQRFGKHALGLVGLTMESTSK